jgi:hypothetical protein
MTHAKVIKAVVETLKKCAQDLGVEPWQVQYNQFVHYASEKLGEDFNDAQVKIKEAGGFRTIKEAHFPPKVPDEAIILSTLARNNRKLAKLDASDSVFFNKYKDSLQKIFKNKITVPKLSYKKPKFFKRALHLIHSDNHIGAFLDPREGTLKYSSVEAARRLACIGVQTVEYKPQYRKETKLYVNSIGDIINGIIHTKLKDYDLAEQICMAEYYMVQWLLFLASEFPEVEVNCSTGNHDRSPEIHPDRAVDGKTNSYATMIYYATKLALQTAKVPNIKINIPRSPYYTYKCFDANYFATHGDTVINVGNPGSSVNVKSIETQITRLNANKHDSDKIDVFMMGHVHTKMHLTLNNGVELITNPPLIPSDSYAQSIGIFETKTGQFLFESVEGHPVGDSRTLKVDTNTDKDESFDKIIKPFIDY